MRRVAALALTALASLAGPAMAQQVKVEEFTLDNGMKFLLVPRYEEPHVVATGWVAKVGSANERPGITGISHFFEHMMFKGTTTIGTQSSEKDAEFRAKQKAVKDRILELTLKNQYRRWTSGEIDDPWDPANDTEELSKLRGELNQLMKDHKAVIVKDEFDKIYTDAGATGLNAFTSNDMTFYLLTTPSNKLELWAWMESDRLADSVFREFYSERDVVHEERRLRTESTPTGVFQEQFDALFWQASPYAWPVIGWTSDLNSYTMEQAQDYFDIYYRPNNIVGVLVGDFKPEEVKPILTKYFGRLKRGAIDPPKVSTLEMKQMAEQRMLADCDCQPQTEVRYKTVPFGHKDEAPLEVMAQLLNGRTGRLYKSMIEGAQIASTANASAGEFFSPRKYAGAFSFNAETKGNATPEQLEEAWYKELERFKNELTPDQELQKVKNQFAANSYRRLQNNFFLMIQVGICEGMGNWEYLNDFPKRVQAVTAEDVKRVANTYFDKTNRSVALYHRIAGSVSEGEDPEFAKIAEKIGPQMAAGLKKQLEQIKKTSDLEKLRTAVAQMEEAKAAGQIPPQMTPMVDYVAAKINERITELEKAAPAADGK